MTKLILVNFFWICVLVVSNVLLWQNIQKLKKDIIHNNDVTWKVHFLETEDVWKHYCVDHGKVNFCNDLNEEYDLENLQSRYQYSPGHYPESN